MRRPSLSSLAVLSLLSLSSPALAQAPAADSTHAGELTAHMFGQAVSQARANPPAPVAAPAVQAPPESPPPTEVGLGEVVKLVVQALTSRNWGLLACALVLGAVYVVRRFLSPRVPWLSSDVAGVLLSMATAVSLALVAALQAGTPISLSLVLGALLTAAGASGLFSWGKKLTAAAKGRVAVKAAIH
ncbi:hypothetical protein D187_007515 [Cystobacter fuscus DSM 2262]|uniref:Uncharacterized protein n=1 Tax=Cystobacter fuscus (strain ATCC 25194 / DSM 2262 / NBRC 100088 / M29) TaxID=1242864 RepID=S9QIA3_CYSF2|nr:hypothetical protein [Cystobacter fuscus]EPX56173.1 hypothetical protein D187_007515 [Cystobacter fuscus DSM 2262]